MNLEEARKRFPGERLWQCEGCGYTASYGSREPPGPTRCYCGGLIRPLDKATEQPGEDPKR